MKLQERIDVLVQLGDHLRGEDEYLQAVIKRTAYNNAWFTEENQQQAIDAIAEHYLRGEQLDKWLAPYEIPDGNELQNIGMILAGNIPLVGFHDLLCVFIAGHRALIKPSEKDPYLLPYLLKLMERFDERSAYYFRLVDRLRDYDAVIATGSGNSARYFESYFGKVPNIIRRNRNGIAVLTGQESPESLHELGKDIFSYFGLGCRNVSKIYVPRSYDFQPLLEALHEYRHIVRHRKYKNNFDYNFAVHVLNKAEFMSNGCVVLTENPSIHSRLGELYYEYYPDLVEMQRVIENRQSEIQCVVAAPSILPVKTFPFGKAQEPELWDYADGVDTMAFLLGLTG